MTKSVFLGLPFFYLQYVNFSFVNSAEFVILLFLFEEKKLTINTFNDQRIYGPKYWTTINDKRTRIG